MPPRKYGKEGLIQDIQEFIGKDGCIPMEHGFKPTMNASSFEFDGMTTRIPIEKGKRKILYADMDEKQLMNVIRTLFQYLNYCHLYA